MTYTHDDLAQVLVQLDRLAGPVPPVDQVQGQRRAHLRQRGQAIAQDQDLGQVAPEDLERLGELDAIGQHPDLDPGLAVALETIAAGRDHNPHPSWDEYVAAHQGHRHARNETCSEPGPGPAPETGTTVTPEMSGNGSANAIDAGQAEHHSRSRPETKQTKLREEAAP
jgi:hypothetical protein